VHEDEPTADELAARRRAAAQGSAADLERMGIDPSMLGLQGAGTVPPAGPTDEHPQQGPVGGAEVVPLRPGHRTTPQEQRPTPGPPVQDHPEVVPPQPVRPTYAGERPSPAPVPVDAGTSARTTDRALGPVEALLARSAEHRPAPSRSRRWLSAVTFGLLTPDAAESAHGEQFLISAVRTRQSRRRVAAFLSGKGGVGATTVAIGVGRALAAIRDDSTVLLDARGGTPSLGQMLGDRVAPNGHDLVQAGSDLAPAQLPGGLHVVDSCGWDAPLRGTDAGTLLERLGRDHAFTLVDVGNDPGEAARATLLRCDQVVVVTNAGHWGVGSAQLALTRLRQLDPYAAEQAIHVVVCTADESYRRVHREVMAQLAGGPVRVVVIPPDPSLRAGQPFDPSAVRPATLEAVLEVAAAVAVSGGVL
jgi:MinD-like ATPase involved in chromosome partitioning or flagellar assembly